MPAQGRFSTSRSAVRGLVVGSGPLRAMARSVRRLPDGRLDVGIEFADGQDPERARLALALFRTHVLPAGEDETSNTAEVAA